MIRFLLFILAIVPISVSAITYNGSTTPSFPDVFEGGNLVFDSFLGGFYNNSSYYYSGISEDIDVQAFGMGYLFTPWYTNSGILTYVSTWDDDSTTAIAWGIQIRLQPTATGTLFVADKFYNNSITVEITGTETLFFLASDFVSPTGNGDFLIFFFPLFISNDCVLGSDCWLFLRSVELYLYTRSDNFVEHTTVDFSDTPYGDSIKSVFRTMTGSSESFIGGYSTIAGITQLLLYPWAWYTWPDQVTDFLQWTGWSLSYYLYNWVSADWLVNFGSGSNGGSSTWSITDWWYTDCEWFTDIMCYVRGTIDGITNALFPEITFNGSFQSCDYQVQWSTGSYMQRFANIIAVVNPIPPSSGSTICMLWNTWTVTYQRIIPDENFFEHYVPWALPEIENIETKIYGQSIFDIVTIFALVILIFYHKNS